MCSVRTLATWLRYQALEYFKKIVAMFYKSIDYIVFRSKSQKLKKQSIILQSPNLEHSLEMYLKSFE